MALYIVYKSEGGQMISAIDSQGLAKLHQGSGRAKIREVLNKEKQSVPFWKVHHNNFPTLSQLVPYHLSIPASSAPVERLFSIAESVPP